MDPPKGFSRRCAILQLLFWILTIVVSGLEIIEYPSEVQRSRSYKITYTPADDIPTTFTLRKGPAENLDTIAELTTSATGGTFIWTVGDDLSIGDDYALEIQRGSENNYGGFINLSGGADTVSSSAPSSSSSQITTSARTATSSRSEQTPTSRQSSTSTNIGTTITSITSTPNPTTSPSDTVETSTRGSETRSWDVNETSKASLSSIDTSSPTATASVSHGLSTGEKAGIGIGASIGGLILIIAAFWFAISLKRKKLKASDTEAAKSPGQPEIDGKEISEVHEVDGHSLSIIPPKESILVSNTPAQAELETPSTPQTQNELHGNPIPAQLNTQGGLSTPQELAAPPRVAPKVNGQQLHELPQSLPYEHPQLTENPWAQVPDDSDVSTSQQKV